MPLPWSGTEPPFGFSPAGASAEPWLPQPKEWRDLTVAAETAHPDSMLKLYRAALHIRRSEPTLDDSPLAWQSSADGVLAFDRGAGGAGEAVRCVVNLSAEPIGLPPHDGVLLASGPLDDGLLPRDTAVWLRTLPVTPGREV